jgi:2-polyprenyl-6-methoxyphenol hydroxylase-like FAD-dependent oxidoreductase
VDSTHFGHHIAASRDVFRKILMQHLNVQFSKRFARYEEDRDGVTVHFEDGTTARGSILIGADGANSSVRAQLLPDFKPVLSKFVSISGNVVLPKHLYGPLLNRGNTGIISGEPGLKFYILVLEYLDDDTALFNWLCALQSEEAEADHEWAREASEESLLKKALMILNHFPSYIVDAVKCTGPTGMHKPPIRLLETILPLQSLPKGRVTLMGDSAHSMVCNTIHHSRSFETSPKTAIIDTIPRYGCQYGHS